MITRDSRRILIADDSLFFRTKLSDILIEAGHKVRTVSDGRGVINEIKINSSGIDLLVLDLQMPDIDGFGVLQWISGNGHTGKFPILAVTGVYEPVEVMERLKNMGASGLVTKGFTPEQIIFRVNRLLFPDKAQTDGRDLTDRVPISVPVDFTVGDLTRTGFLLNISETGTFLHTKAELLPGTLVGLKFSLPGTNRIVAAKGIVRWTTKGMATKTLFGGAGVMFSTISPEDKDIVKEFSLAEFKKLGFGADLLKPE